MDVDHKRKLALLSRDPRAYAGSTTREPGEPDPNGATEHRRRLRGRRGTRATASSSASSSCRRAHDDVRERLQVALDRRPGRDADAAGPPRAGPSGGRSSSPTSQPAQPAGLPDGAGRPVPPRRRDRLLARRPGRRHGHRLGLGRRRHARLLDARPALRPARRSVWRKATRARRRSRTRAAASEAVTGDTTGGFEHNAERPVGWDAPQGRPALPPRQAAAQHRGGLRPRRTRPCRNRGQFAISSLEGSFDGEAWRSTPASPFRLETVGTWNPSEKEGSRPIGGPVQPAGQLLLGPLLRRGRQHGHLRLVRRGHAVPRHLRPGQPDPVRLLAARRRGRLGLVHAPRLRLHRGPHPRRGRAEAHRRGEGGTGGRTRGLRPAPSDRQRRFLARLAAQYKLEPGTAGICLLQI